MVVGFLTLWVKLKYGADKVEETASKVEVVEKKLDMNTQITRAGTVEAAINAQEAVKSAIEAKDTATETREVVLAHMNGGVAQQVAEALAPIHQALAEHTRHDDRLMEEIRLA